MVGAWTRRLKRSLLQAARSSGGEIMCSLMGLSLAWWSQLGLFLDFFGFMIFAVDVYRDYSRDKRALAYSQGAQSALRLSRYRPDPPLPEDADEVAKLISTHRETAALVDRALVILAWEKLHRTGHPPHELGYDEIARQLSASASSAPSEPYKKPPMFFGLVLVSLGFLLQLIGNWPCS